MSKKESYIETWFKIIISEEFPEINDELLEKYSNIKEKIFSENQNASKELMMHLESQIVPAITITKALTKIWTIIFSHKIFIWTLNHINSPNLFAYTYIFFLESCIFIKRFIGNFSKNCWYKTIHKWNF